MSFLFIHRLGGAFFLLMLLAYMILWIYCMIDVIRSDFKDTNMKLIWVVILLLAQVFGPISYLILGHGTKKIT